MRTLEQITLEQTGKALKQAILKGGYTHNIDKIDGQYVIGMYGVTLPKFAPLGVIQRTINGLVYSSLQDPDALTFGLWFEGELLYIDICTTAYLPAEAINKGRKYGQKAIYNKTFDKVEYIETLTGGTKTR